MEIDRGPVQPKYLAGAHITKGERAKAGRLIIDAVPDAASAVPSDDTARYTNNYGAHFARFAKSVGVLYLHQITEDLLLGFCRSLILQPDAKNGAYWYSTVNLG